MLTCLEFGKQMVKKVCEDFMTDFSATKSTIAFPRCCTNSNNAEGVISHHFSSDSQVQIWGLATMHQAGSGNLIGFDDDFESNDSLKITLPGEVIS